MGLYEKYILPRIIDWGCGQAVMQEQRRRVVPLAHGRVLEIGIGSGHNLAHYDPNNVERVIGVDPSAELLAKARRRTTSLSFQVELLNSGFEGISIEDHSVDSVLMTFTLCTLPSVESALAQVRRVLKPSGALLFCEHGRAPEPAVQRWQDRLNPVWKRCFGGCNINRDMPALLRESGFRLESLESDYLPDVPRIAGYRYSGIARVNG